MNRQLLSDGTGGGANRRVFKGERLNHVAFPMGGLGAGMICLEGIGAFSHVSLRHKPEMFNTPLLFGALHVAGAPTARVLEGPIPMCKVFGHPVGGGGIVGNRTAGLPRFSEAQFEARFPFGTVCLRDPAMPAQVTLTGWSPFIPGCADDVSLPVAAMEYRFRNPTRKTLHAVFSFHAENFLCPNGDAGSPVVRAIRGGFIVGGERRDKKSPEMPAHFAVFTDDSRARTDCAWFRGACHDALTMVWRKIALGQSHSARPHRTGDPGQGASVYVPFALKPGAERVVRMQMAWYVPRSALSAGQPLAGSGCGCGDACGSAARASTYVPWYTKRFASIDAVVRFWRSRYAALRNASRQFSDCFYDTTLPPEAVDAVAANLTILKSPTCLRHTDGRLWGWEGCADDAGCCHGSCTHVWNYAQAIPHLFPALERGLRETEFLVSQDERGHQNFRTALPIGPTSHEFHAAADGQLGGIVKLYREWRIGGDTAWMHRLWPDARRSLEYGIATWDPDETGLLVEPHHNTYDIEFWGPESMCSSFYLAALAAAIRMGEACGDDVQRYRELLARGRKAIARELWNGDYFTQRVRWKDLRNSDPTRAQAIYGSYSPEAVKMLRRDGPKYQVGTGCLSDGVLGEWLARVSGLDSVLDQREVARHLDSVFRHNFRPNLSHHANPQRPGYALGREGGLVLCSWPRGDKRAIPFIFSDEVWTGTEYQVASHLIMMGRVKQGLRLVRAVRKRYDGRYRNPFNEYECGNWYARAMSSYALLQALSGARYDAVEKKLYLQPAIRRDFRAFLCTATGYGTVGIKRGRPFIEVRSGSIPIKAIVTKPEI